MQTCEKPLAILASEAWSEVGTRLNCVVNVGAWNKLTRGTSHPTLGTLDGAIRIVHGSHPLTLKCLSGDVNTWCNIVYKSKWWKPCHRQSLFVCKDSLMWLYWKKHGEGYPWSKEVYWTQPYDGPTWGVGRTWVVSLEGSPRVSMVENKKWMAKSYVHISSN